MDRTDDVQWNKYSLSVIQGYFDAAEGLAAGPRIGAAAQICLNEVFHVRHAVAAVLQEV